MKWQDIKEDGRIVKGVNTSPDVDTNSIPKEAGKFGNKVDKDGRPPTLSKKVKGKSTNVLFNLGLAERFTSMEMALMEGGHSIEVYRRDQLPQIKNKQLSKIKHTVETVALTDIIPVQEERIVENFKRQVDKIVAGEYKPIIVDKNYKIVNGHHRYTALQMLKYENVQVAVLPWTLEMIIEKWSAKYKKSIDCNNPKGFSQKAHCAGRKKKAYNESTDLDSLKKFVRSQREAPDQVLYQMMMAPDTYGHSASNFVRSWYERTKEENGLNDVDSALEIMVDALGLNENFADGKRKGKSRPGRVKRSGASCKGSVTKLRKQAKNASGEKARMYHWCANMKSGRSKT